MLVTLIDKFPHKFESAYFVLMRCCQNMSSDIRRILVSGMHEIIKLNPNKLRILDELKELLDDEEPTVKQ
jgi:hypothetical protein